MVTRRCLTDCIPDWWFRRILSLSSHILTDLFNIFEEILFDIVGKSEVCWWRLLPYKLSMIFFPDFQNYCRSFLSLADFWTVVADKIASFNMFYGTRAVHLIYEMLLTGFAVLVFFTVSRCVEFLWRSSLLFLHFTVKRYLHLILDRKSLQECSINVGFSQGSFHILIYFVLYIGDLPVSVICNIAVFLIKTTLYTNYVCVSEL